MLLTDSTTQVRTRCAYTVCLSHSLVQVNPQAVNEPGFDVFTDNKRSVLYMMHTPTNAPVAFVAIGAMLVCVIPSKLGRAWLTSSVD